ncbi:hypothetical protein D3C78_448490 [compost metagenome]
MLQHAERIDRAIAHGLGGGVGHDEQIQRPVLFKIAPAFEKVLHDALDLVRQRWPAKVLVLDVDESGRVVDGLQVDLLDVADVFLALGPEYLRHDGRAIVWSHAQLSGEVFTRAEQVDAGFFFPGGTEVVVQELKHRTAHSAGNILPGRFAVASELPVMSHVAVIIIVPIGIQRVVPHHEPDGDLRLLVVHQHHFLVVARLGDHRHRTHDFVGRVAILVQCLPFQAPGNFRTIQQAEVASDEFDVLDPQRGIVAP